mmetsp:Transcript_25506/g.58871  ORF Transcript_25506/g.58871 Transcript_25506/m.58871 type:complete len:210 (+) Transcript_25506:1121-1750(+)
MDRPRRCSASLWRACLAPSASWRICSQRAQPSAPWDHLHTVAGSSSPSPALPFGRAIRSTKWRSMRPCSLSMRLLGQGWHSHQRAWAPGLPYPSDAFPFPSRRCNAPTTWVWQSLAEALRTPVRSGKRTSRPPSIAPGRSGTYPGRALRVARARSSRFRASPNPPVAEILCSSSIRAHSASMPWQTKLSRHSSSRRRPPTFCSRPSHHL